MVSRIDAKIAGLNFMPTSHSPLHEQRPDPAAPRLREMLHGRGALTVRVMFRIVGDVVRVLQVRPAAARPLSDREVRRLARG